MPRFCGLVSMASARAELKTVISADSSQFSTAMRRAGMVASETGSKIKKAFTGKVGAAIAGAGAAIAGAFAAQKFAQGIKGAADMGGQLSDLSARTGIAAGKLAILQRAFEDNGVSGDQVGTVINKLQKSIFEFGQGAAKPSKAFSQLGISFDEISKLSPDEQFAKVQKAIAAIPDPAARAAMAMQLFGKSGGQLLTLFADEGAIANAGKFLGTQAEILNRQSATFDSISDILARSGQKFQGFFVGILDVVGPPLLKLLEAFDALDFAKIGQDAGKFIMSALDMTFQMADLAYQWGQRLVNGTEAAWVLLKATFGSDFWVATGKLIMAAMGDGANALVAGVNAANAMLLQFFAEMPNLIWNAWKFLTDPGFWESVKNSLLNIAMSFASSLIGWLGKAFKMIKEMDFQGLKDLGKEITDQITKGSGDGFKFVVGDGVKDSFDRIAKAGRDAFTGTKPVFDTGKLKDDAAKTFGGIGDEWKKILNRPIESLPDAVKEFVEKYKTSLETATEEGAVPKIPEMQRKADEAAAAGFKGLSGLYQMQADKAAGIGLGTTNAFAKDRERLGIASGLTTGGLGEKRRLATSKDQREAKKALSAQEAQLDKLSSIDSNIKQALTVA